MERLEQRLRTGDEEALAELIARYPQNALYLWV